MKDVKTWVLSGRMPGRPKTYSDLEGLQAKESVRTWLRGVSEGDARNTALYAGAASQRSGPHPRWSPDQLDQLPKNPAQSGGGMRVYRTPMPIV